MSRLKDLVNDKNRNSTLTFANSLKMKGSNVRDNESSNKSGDNNIVTQKRNVNFAEYLNPNVPPSL